jgi:hypothetical protein
MTNYLTLLPPLFLHPEQEGAMKCSSSSETESNSNIKSNISNNKTELETFVKQNENTMSDTSNDNDTSSNADSHAQKPPARLNDNQRKDDLLKVTHEEDPKVETESHLSIVKTSDTSTTLSSTIGSQTNLNFPQRVRNELKNAYTLFVIWFETFAT